MAAAATGSDVIRSAATLLVGSIALAGCYVAHDRSAPDAEVATFDAGPRDAGRDSATDAGLDSGLDAGVDAGVDGGLCEGVSEEPLLHLCSFEALGGLPAGEPATLTLFFAECLCPTARGCGVRVVDGAIELDTWRCPESEACDDCTTDLPCAIPPLAAGLHPVRVDGAPIATVEARASMPIARPTCWDVQDPIAGYDCGGPPVALAPRELCHRPLEDVGTEVEIALVQDLPACTAPAECRAALEGSRIVLTASALACSSETGCSGPPVERITRCVTPPLRAGDYTIVAEGSALESLLQIRDITRRGEVVCVGSP